MHPAFRAGAVLVALVSTVVPVGAGQAPLFLARRAQPSFAAGCSTPRTAFQSATPRFGCKRPDNK